VVALAVVAGVGRVSFFILNGCLRGRE
jgi:hypothetical protein